MEEEFRKKSNEELDTFNLEKQYKNGLREQEQAKLIHDSLKKQIGKAKEVFEIKKKNSLLATKKENFQMLRPIWKFEELEEYIEDSRRINQINMELATYDFDMQHANREKLLKDAARQVEFTDDNVADLKKKLEKVKTNG